MNLTDEQLDDVLGTSQEQFQKYRTFTVDNGSDLLGTGATGDFVEKTYNAEKKEAEKTNFAPEFPGVILSAKAKLVDKGKTPTWVTSEFDRSNQAEQISVYQLKKDGSFVKDNDGKVKKKFMTYNEIETARQVPQPDGSKQSTYNYTIILYIWLDTDEDEIIKLKFKGTARGNYFNYSRHLSSLGAKLYNVETTFSTYTDKETGKYTIAFKIVEKKDGSPASVDAEKVREMRIKIANNVMSFKNKQIAQPAQEQLPEPENQEDASADINMEDLEETGAFDPERR